MVQTLLIGQHPQLRLTLRTVLVAAAVYALSLLAEWHAVTQGMADGDAARKLAIFVVVGMGFFYAVIRAGLTLRLSDPSMTLPQMVFAIVAIAIAYHINPLVRGALPMLAGLVILFGAFTLRPRQCIALGWFAVAVFGATIGFGAWRQPMVFNPLIESHHMTFVIAVFTTMSYLTARLSRLRASWKKQNRDLK